MNEHELLRRFPNASKSVLARNVAVSGSPPRAVMECAVGHGALPEAPPKAADTSRYLVRVVSYRTRLLDEDNLAEKYHVDACRYAGLIPTDSPDQTTIQVSQEKVAKKEQERTEIEISRRRI